MPLNWERLENIIQFSEVTESGVVSRNRSSLTGQTGADGTAATLFQFMMHWCVNSSRGDVSGTLRSAPTAKVDDEQGANPLNKSKPKGPQTLVFMYTGEVSHIIKGSGYEVCKGGWCCNKEWHRFEMSRSQGSGMGTVQVQTQLVNISCEEKKKKYVSQ